MQGTNPVEPENVPTEYSAISLGPLENEYYILATTTKTSSPTNESSQH